MNDAQLFLVFLAILGFGWIGFFSRKAWSDDEIWRYPTMIFFFMASIGLFIAMATNLISLVGRNF